MKRHIALALVVFAVAPYVLAADRSGVAILPAGTNLDLLLASTQELLKREGYQVDTAALSQGRLVGTLHRFFTQSGGSAGGLWEEWRRWTFSFTREAGGEVRIEVQLTSSHAEERPYEIAAELQNIVAGKGVNQAKSLLTIDGVTKPLAEWTPDRR